MKVNYVKVMEKDAQREIARLRAADQILTNFRIRREGNIVLIPVKESDMIGEFQQSRENKMKHVGSFERIADFFVIKEREGWESIMNEIIRKQNPRAIFLDKGVEGLYRLRNLEKVFGEGTPEGIHRENGLRYYVDLRRAYFSPRLAGIRQHISKQMESIREGEAVVDMYAGIGPISIPLLKRGVRVISIDINRDAVNILKYNMRLNSVNGDAIIANSNEIYECFRNVRYVIMNNPTQSLETSSQIVNSFPKGTQIHFLHIVDRGNDVDINGVTALEKRVVHGYSPSQSLIYLRLMRI